MERAGRKVEAAAMTNSVCGRCGKFRAVVGRLCSECETYMNARYPLKAVQFEDLVVANNVWETEGRFYQVGAKELAEFIGKRVRVTIEEIEK